ncbi:ribonuclease HII [Vibrio sp. 10N.261.46.E11]|uniref:ribonuclease HII n=1 Tax=Vibrio sp. 10N.261.46.E11 TaxID=3229662 RepID=UPI002A738312|nr:RNase HII [Vibrio crassostreae]CAK2355327.1 RNase HII [Vibrio crassostreae]CAK2440342.1 RNase HII [Vibrio crassostreae]CAK3008292.1 RNase HII [Vibrio crassostreae]
MAVKEKKEFPPFEYPQGYQLFAGVDEVGRGPLVGDVVTAAVILDPNNPIEGLNDSKKLSEKKRLALLPEIKEKALAWSVGRCSPQEIDEWNILQATMVAMQRAIAGLSVQPDMALIDGNRVPQLPMDGLAIIKGDLRVAEISAASIIAKVVRDQEMEELDKLHPEFGFAKHKGYPTKAHFEAIEKHGVTEHYRKSFKPVKRILGID